MGAWHERVADLADRVGRMALYAGRRDPRLRTLAFNLDEGARSLEGEARMAALETRDASVDLRRLARRIEADSLDRKAMRMSDAARLLGIESRRLLGKVQ